METSLQGEITSLREEIARSSSNYMPQYSQSTFLEDQGGASGFHEHFGGEDLQGLGLNKV
jgi:hypothetical protein